MDRSAIKYWVLMNVCLVLASVLDVMFVRGTLGFDWVSVGFTAVMICTGGINLKNVSQRKLPPEERAPIPKPLIITTVCTTVIWIITFIFVVRAK